MLSLYKPAISLHSLISSDSLYQDKLIIKTHVILFSFVTVVTTSLLHLIVHASALGKGCVCVQPAWYNFHNHITFTVIYMGYIGFTEDQDKEKDKDSQDH